MFTRNFTVLINILPFFVMIWDFKCALSMPKRYRIYRTKGPPSMPPILQFSPPRLASAQNFHSDYAPPPMTNSMSSYSPPSFDPPNNFLDYQPPGIQMEYGPPKINNEYGPPKVNNEYGPPKIHNEYGPPKINNEYGPPTTSKPVVHKHVSEKNLHLFSNNEYLFKLCLLFISLRFMCTFRLQSLKIR